MLVEKVLVPLICTPQDERCAATLARYYDENSAGIDPFYKPYYDAVVTVASMWGRSICATHAADSDPVQFENDFSVCLQSALDSRFPFFADFRVEALGELSSYESLFVKAGIFFRGLAAPVSQ